jgi:hypothetical protein
MQTRRESRGFSAFWAKEKSHAEAQSRREEKDLSAR